MTSLDDGDEVGYIFLYHTPYGKVQIAILECVSLEDARQQADDHLKARGFEINE